MNAGPIQRLVLCLALASAVPTPADARAQADAQRRTVLPSKAGLVPVHTPDLDRLEAAVGEQLRSLEESLAALTSDSSIDDRELSEAYGLLGEAYHAYSLTSPAEECYRNARRLAPKEFRWVYFLGHIAQSEGRTEAALTYYSLARPLRPNYLALPVHVGNLHLGQNHLDEAREHFEQALVIDPTSAAARYGLGQVAVSAGNYAQAIEYFHQALAQVPNANRIHYAMAMAYRGLGDIEAAQANLMKQGPVGTRAPDPLADSLQSLIRGDRIHLLRGRLAFDAGRFAEAADEFRKAAAANPDSIPADVNLGASLALGTALAQLGDLNGAGAEFKAVLRLDPRNTAAHYNMAVLFVRQGKPDRAIVHLQTLLSLNPQDADARSLLGRVSAVTGHPGVTGETAGPETTPPPDKETR